ncbi:MAG: hypothetical protein JRI26_11245 [Deltaproteobacteria bacterium]|nr:hypothetical protein [Deltaproteobacteria bacterium]
MGAGQKNLRIPQETLEEIEKVAHQSSSDFSSIAKAFLTEAIKMRRCPGIVFADGVSGRKARIAGIGLEVWEIIAIFKGVSENFKRLHRVYHLLTEQQARTVIGYYTTYLEKINGQI